MGGDHAHNNGYRVSVLRRKQKGVVIMELLAIKIFFTALLVFIFTMYIRREAGRVVSERAAMIFGTLFIGCATIMAVSMFVVIWTYP